MALARFLISSRSSCFISSVVLCPSAIYKYLDRRFAQIFSAYAQQELKRTDDGEYYCDAELSPRLPVPEKAFEAVPADRYSQKYFAALSEVDQANAHDARMLVTMQDMFLSIAPMTRAKARIEKELDAQAPAYLPPRVLKYIGEVVGLTPRSVMRLVGEAGDISLYKGVAHLWSRFGVGVKDGGDGNLVAQGKTCPQLVGTSAGRKVIKDHKYCKRRRSLLKVVGDNLRRGSKADPYYIEVINAEKTRQTKKLKAEVESGERGAKNKCGTKYNPEGHADTRAMRYASKRLLLNLWCLWTDNEPGDTSDAMNPNNRMPGMYLVDDIDTSAA